MNDMRRITPGRYRHYKGGEYVVIGIGKDTETVEDVVIYRPQYDSEVQYWVRPYTMFADTVIVDGKTVARFTRVAADEE